MRRKRNEARDETFVAVAERLRPYVDASFGENGSLSESPAATEPGLLDELMERAVTLVTVMPRNQRRETIEGLISPHDPERGRRVVDALIHADLVVADETGHLRLSR